MKQAATRELYSYWNHLRGERLSPERGEIDPAAIRGILADTFMLEVDGARSYPFRLSGTRSNALFMQDLKGRAFHSLWHERDRPDIADLLAHVCDNAAAVVAGVTAAPVHRTPIELELLLLPVRHLGKTHARILGCLAPAQIATWIGLLPVNFLSLHALRILAHAPQPDQATATGALACAREALTASGDRREGAGAKSELMRHGHLFVHHNTR